MGFGWARSLVIEDPLLCSGAFASVVLLAHLELQAPARCFRAAGRELLWLCVKCMPLSERQQYSRGPQEELMAEGHLCEGMWDHQSPEGTGPVL